MKNTSKSEFSSNRIKFYTAIIAIVWTGALPAISFIDFSIDRKDMIQEARINANAAYEKDLVYRRWNADHGGVYVPVTEKTPSNPYLDVPNKDVTTNNGTALTLMNPAYMTRQVHELARESYGILGHITSLNPIRPQNAPDPWEIAALKSFQQGTREVYSEVKLEGKPYLRFMRPLVTEKRCLKCHAKQGYREGDIRGGISISVPLDSYFATHAKHVQFAIWMYVLIWIAGIGFFAYSTYRISNQIKIRDKAETDRKKAEDELRESEILNRSLLEGSPVCNKIIDLDFKLRYMSAAGIKRLKIPDIKPYYGQTYPPTFYPESMRAPLIKNLKLAMAGKISSVEAPVHDMEGNEVWYYTTFVPAFDNDGLVKYVIGTSVDITERLQMQEQLQQSQKMEAVGTLAGGIAHNFNNILGAVMGFTEMAIDDIPENLRKDSLLRHNLNEVMKASRRATDLVKQILSFSRKSAMVKMPVNMNLVLKDALEMLRSTIRSTIDIRQNISCPSGTVSGNETEISQVIMNLCINAEQAIPETGGVIEVSLENIYLKPEEAAKYQDNIQPGTHVQLTVSDTGPGIDQKTINRIFEPFFTTKEVGKGTGMGLSAVHGIVTGHNGTITVESEPGKGTTFKVLFPVSQEKAETEAKTDEPLPTGTEQILFVDDEESFADMGKQLLERLGYKVTIKLNGNEALEAFRSRPDKFDLVITDYDMPGMTGDVLTKELLNIRKDIPVIISTGYGHLITDGKIEARGVKIFIMKPFEKRQIAKAIRDVLDGK